MRTVSLQSVLMDTQRFSSTWHGNIPNADSQSPVSAYGHPEVLLHLAWEHPKCGQSVSSQCLWTPRGSPPPGMGTSQMRTDSLQSVLMDTQRFSSTWHGNIPNADRQS